MSSPRLFVVDKYPAEYASGVYINERVWAQFSVPISSGSATYYNFTVSARDTYEPVPGTISVQGLSGEINNAIIIFTPTYALTRNTDYSVLVSTGIQGELEDVYLSDDLIWYFTTGDTAASGSIGYPSIILPSGYTDPNNPYNNGLNPNGMPFAVDETVPIPFDSNIPLDLPFIALHFNAPIPSGINIADHVKLTARRIFG